ncbi:MAG: hypothetical protein K8I30_14105, partial [Anaerolineae bacterium]|nr:hypothetical protein [Anaerolineae bacterium]
MNIPRLYARLLRLYPRPFYTRFGDEMLDVFEQAWTERRAGFWAALRFCVHEFGGLAMSIGRERWHAQNAMRFLFRWRLIPVWLLAFSLVAAMLLSLHYWGYIVQPASNFGALTSVDNIVLVEFDAAYHPTRVPIQTLPHLTTDTFPPSQILPWLKPDEAQISDSLDATLADQLAAVLAQEGINLGRSPIDYPTEPQLKIDDCEQCFRIGLQPQPDGSFLQIFPEVTEDGFTDKTIVRRITPNEWWYYHYITPAAYVVEGRAADGTPLVFAGIASASISGDRYHYYEYVFEAAASGLVVQDRMDYRYDISGLEGLNFLH